KNRLLHLYSSLYSSLLLITALCVAWNPVYIHTSIICGQFQSARDSTTRGGDMTFTTTNCQCCRQQRGSDYIEGKILNVRLHGEIFLWTVPDLLYFCGEETWRVSQSVLYCLRILNGQLLDALDPSETRKRTGVDRIH
ncbi:hypothetical protein AMELA_G00020720, partial [Ameiurus melas]